MRIAEINEGTRQPRSETLVLADERGVKYRIQPLSCTDHVGREQILLVPIPVAEHLRVIPWQNDVVNVHDHPWSQTRQYVDHEYRNIGIHEGAVRPVEE